MLWALVRLLRNTRAAGRILDAVIYVRDSRIAVVLLSREKVIV